MKSNKGITLTSLIIYIIVFTIVIGTVATLSGYFTSNLNNVVISSDASEQYTRLTTYLSNDINSINFETMDVGDDYINITFKDGSYHKYLYNDNKIYYISAKEETLDKKISLCVKIEDCNFTYENNKLKISIKIDGITYNNNYSISI